MGSRAVTSIGIASVIHQIAIHAVAANTPFPVGVKPSGSKKKRISKKDSGPSKRPILFLFIIVLWLNEFLQMFSF